MRYESFKKNEYYHVTGKGIGGEKIFIDDQDRIRFIFLITHLQSPIKIYNISWYSQSFIKKGVFNTKEKNIESIIKKRNVELVAFTLLPNRFELLVKNLDDCILSVYMHRVLTSYSKYFNSKYKKNGHVFESSFRAVHVSNSNQLLLLSASIHNSPKEIDGWGNSCDSYPYSSFQDYIGLNRWGGFLFIETILKQFKNNQLKYRDFVISNTEKKALDHL